MDLIYSLTRGFVKEMKQQSSGFQLVHLWKFLRAKRGGYEDA